MDCRFGYMALRTAVLLRNVGKLAGPSTYF
jgi:hypothetical protein